MKITRHRSDGPIPFNQVATGIRRLVDGGAHVARTVGNFCKPHLPRFPAPRPSPPASAAPALQRFISGLEIVEKRIFDPPTVRMMVAESWRDIWEQDPRGLTEGDIEVIKARANSFTTRFVTNTLRNIIRRGYLLPEEGPLLRRLYQRLIWPSVPADASSRHTARREVRRRLAAIHPDRWRHAAWEEAVNSMKCYWELAIAFKDLIDHPMIGPPIFNERPAPHEFLPQCSIGNPLLEDGKAPAPLPQVRSLPSRLAGLSAGQWSALGVLAVAALTAVWLVANPACTLGAAFGCAAL